MQETFRILPIKVIVALGGIAWTAAIMELKAMGWYDGPTPKFGHGVQVKLADGRLLIGSYHPSQQNTFTGRLTEPMLDGVFQAAAKFLKQK